MLEKKTSHLNDEQMCALSRRVQSKRLQNTSIETATNLRL